ncbi:hypothetical protein OAQ39_02305 [Alphaproteobacteria bacterium]|nr:hypothetical protein [Alphaproteobacteria bacterium]
MNSIIYIDYPSFFLIIKNFYKIINSKSTIIFYTNYNFKFFFLISFFKCIFFLISKIQFLKISHKEIIELYPEAFKLVEDNDNFNHSFDGFFQIFNLKINSQINIFKRNNLYNFCVQLYIKKKINENANEKIEVISFSQMSDIYQNKIRTVNKSNRIKIFIKLFYLFPLLLILLIKSLFKYNFVIFQKKNNKKFYSKIIYQVSQFGNLNTQGVSENLITNKKEESLLISPYWKIDNNLFKKFIKRLIINDIKHVHFSHFKYNFKNIIFLLKIIFRILSLKNINCNSSEINLILIIFYYFIDEYIQFNNINCKVFVSNDDVSTRHIIRSAYLNKLKINSYGIQHSAGNGLFGAPHIAYINFDLYFVWNDYIINQFSKYWKELNIVKTGYRRIDNFLKKDFKKHKSVIQNNLNIHYEFYDINKRNILITLPSFDHSLENFSNFYKNSSEIFIFFNNYLSKHLSHFNIIIRPKRKITKEFIDYIHNINRALIVCDKFDISTIDLIYWSDLIISSNVSGVISEASLLKKKIVSFDYFDLLSHLNDIYGNELIANKASKLDHILCKFQKNDIINVHWNVLWDEFGFINEHNINTIINKKLL